MPATATMANAITMTDTTTNRIFVDYSQFPINSRLRSICEGTSGLPETGPGNTRESYLRFWSNQPPLPAPAPADLSCIHRGEQTGWADCESCPTAGKVKVKLFACALHGTCSLGKLDGIAFCQACPDRKPPTTQLGGERPPAAELRPEGQPPISFASPITFVVNERHISRNYPGHSGHWTEKIVKRTTRPDGSVTEEEPVFRRLEPHEIPRQGK
jgi:hypothetical protein